MWAAADLHLRSLTAFAVSYATYGGQGVSGAGGAHLGSPGAPSLGLLVSCQAASRPGSTWLVCTACSKVQRGTKQGVGRASFAAVCMLLPSACTLTGQSPSRCSRTYSYYAAVQVLPSWARHAHSAQALHPRRWSLGSRLGKSPLTLARVPVARWAGLGTHWGSALALGSEGSLGLVGVRGLVSCGVTRSAGVRGCHLFAAKHGALLLLGGRTRGSCLGSGTTQEHQLNRSW